MFTVYYKAAGEKMRALLKDRYFIVALILIVVGGFLRLYRLPEFITFLGDQGRDAIIIKRILTVEHFPLIGAPTSYGQVYLGPFYYYFIAPWLGLFNFQPAGLAIGVAVFSTLYLIINYLIVKDIFDSTVAIISTIFLTFAFTLIEFSRFSWNPNLLPLATLLTVYFIIKSCQTKQSIFFILSGIFFSITIQLHYVSLFMIPGITSLFIYHIYKQINNRKNLFKKYLYFICSFILFSSPLVLFDLRHQFLNLNNFIKLFTQSSESSSNKIVVLFETFHDLNKFALNINIDQIITTIVLVFFIIFLFFEYKTKSKSKIFTWLFITNLLTFSLYSGPRFPHYFGTLLPVYYVTIAYLLVKTLKFQLHDKVRLGLGLIIIFLFIYLNYVSYYFITGPSSNQVKQSETVAAAIYQNAPNAPFRLTTLPERSSDATYRYFLEIMGKRPIEKDSIEKTNTLFVVCDKPCKPIGDPQFDIALFAATRVEKQITVNNVIIYKLTNLQ